MIPNGYSKELWEMVGHICRTFGGTESKDGSARVCLKDDDARENTIWIRQKLKDIGIRMEFVGFDDTHYIYSLHRLAQLDSTTKNACPHIIAYANEADAIPCPVCEREQLRSELAKLREERDGLAELFFLTGAEVENADPNSQLAKAIARAKAIREVVEADIALEKAREQWFAYYHAHHESIFDKELLPDIKPLTEALKDCRQRRTAALAALAKLKGDGE